MFNAHRILGTPTCATMFFHSMNFHSFVRGCFSRDMILNVFKPRFYHESVNKMKSNWVLLSEIVMFYHQKRIFGISQRLAETHVPAVKSIYESLFDNLSLLALPHERLHDWLNIFLVAKLFSKDIDFHQVT